MLLPRRARALSAALFVAATALVALPAVALAPAPTASAATECVPGYAGFPNLNGLSSTGTDAGVSAYIGGNFLASTGAQETEGIVVVGGNATYDTHQYFNTGVVGVGSQVRPPADSDMLVTGGNTAVLSGTLEVAHGSTGDIVAGGTITGNYIATTATPNVASPLAPYATFPAHYAALSTQYAALAPTGTVTVDGWQVTFASTTTDAVQVFTVSGADLGASPVSKQLIFSNIPAGAVIIINVTGTAPTVWANSFVFNGTTINPISTADTVFSHVTQSMLWNFSQATSLTLGDGDQLLGSIVAPHTTATTLLTSTNGRVFIAGDVTMGGSTQTGLEIHNYSFREPIDCTPAPTEGSLSITKQLADDYDVIDYTRTFTGTYTCTLGTTPTSGTWSLRAGETVVVDHLPAGAVCTVAEDSLGGGWSVLASAYRWTTPSISKSSVTIVAGATADVTVNNGVRLALGDLQLVKVLDDPFDVVDPNREYTGSFGCQFNGFDVTPDTSTWSTTAGAPAITLATNLPEGAVCTVTEDDLVDPPLAGFPQYQWAAATISPSPVTIADGVTHVVTVTNTVFDPIDTELGTLAITGTSSILPLAIGGSVVALGLVLFVVGRQRRRRAE